MNFILSALYSIFNKFPKLIFCSIIMLYVFEPLQDIKAIESNDLNARKTIDLYYRKLSDMFADPDLDSNEVDEQVLTLVDGLFDFEKLAPQILQRKWAKLNKYEQDSFTEALQVSLKNKIVSQLKKYNNKDSSLLSFESKETKKNFAKLNYSISGNEITIFMIKYPDGLWKVTNVKTGKESLMREYYSFCKKHLSKYSIASLIAEIQNADYVVLENFEAGEIDKLPRGWTWRKRDRKKNKPYKIREENGNKYLAAEDNGESVILGKDLKWDLRKYPYISFRWRTTKLPEGGDERYGKTVDSAAGIYIVYKKRFGKIPSSIKYVWSTTLPVGSYMRRSGIGRPWMVVAESGTDHLGEWRTYVFNAYDAYKKTFGGRPPNNPVGIGILSDANSTHSQAYADYDDIRALKQADADSGVKTFLKAE
ncbi:MAG: DUF3047 domain-containing protein [bacterium]